MELTPFPWQASMDDTLKGTPDDRKIIWMCDIIGGNGKSKFCQWQQERRKAILLSTTSLGDVNFIVANKDGDPRIIIFDLARGYEKFVNYTTLEKLKDGQITSTKYQPTVKSFPNPWILVFANFFPDRSQLTGDRWEIYVSDPEIEKNEAGKFVRESDVTDEQLERWEVHWDAHEEAEARKAARDARFARKKPKFNVPVA